jgi:hypothetical protein
MRGHLHARLTNPAIAVNSFVSITIRKINFTYDVGLVAFRLRGFDSEYVCGKLASALIFLWDRRPLPWEYVLFLDATEEGGSDWRDIGDHE